MIPRLPRSASPPRLIVAAAVALFCCAAALIARLHHPAPYVPRTAAPMRGQPRVMLWAWETPEDLTTLDPSRAGVAFLSREIFLTPGLAIRPRQQPLHLPPAVWLMADVRIETHLTPGTHLDDSPTTRAAIVQAILPAAQQPGVRALQIDFDATASQLDLYQHLLASLRAALPPGIPLSITALPSWCGPASFAARLNAAPHPLVDEAVTMDFRLGGPLSRRLQPKSLAGITDPLCTTAIGVSTDETWPPLDPRQRLYLFRDGPWTSTDLDRLNRLGPLSLRSH